MTTGFGFTVWILWIHKTNPSLLSDHFKHDRWERTEDCFTASLPPCFPFWSCLLIWTICSLMWNMTLQVAKTAFWHSADTQNSRKGLKVIWGDDDNNIETTHMFTVHSLMSRNYLNESFAVVPIPLASVIWVSLTSHPIT